MDKTNPTFKIENNVLKGEVVEYPEQSTSLGKFILDRLESNLDLVGQIDVVTNETYTYGKMRDRSIRCALWMQAQGILPGEVVALISHNQMDNSMPYFAALYIGATVNPLDDLLNANELYHMFNITKPKIAFASQKLVVTVAEAAEKANLELKIVCFGNKSGFFEFEKIIAEAESEMIRNFRYTCIKNSNDTAVILSTSGTTGLPKGVELGNVAVLMEVRQLLDKFKMANNTCLLFSTFSWVTGTICTLMSLLLDIPRLIVPKFEESLACEIIEKYKVSWFFAAPSMVNRLLKADILKQFDLSSMKYVICGGASLTPASQEPVSKYLPNAQIILAYGLSELCGPVTIHQTKSKPGSSGHMIENGELKVIDPENGRLLGVNQKGELLLKTNTMMNGYYGNPQATAEIIDEEGWLHSGDLGYYDEDGEIFVVDRLKEIITFRSFRISPSELESVISTHPGVKEVVVVSVPHPQDDEHPIAFVVRATDSSSSGNEVTEKEIVDLVATELSDSKRLRAGVRFVDQLPKTSSNKIQRQKLRELARSVITA